MSRTAVVGLGLVGGSLALAARARGYDRDPGAREAARRRGIETADTLETAVAGADLIVAAVPTSETAAVLASAAAAVPSALLTDCASLKRPVAAAAASLPPGARFVAGHPMAGAAGRGVEAADPELFRGRPWALVRTARSDDASVAEVEAFVRSLGARPIHLDAEAHDRAMTWASHLPLAAAAAIARSVGSGPAEAALLAGPGLRDTTRLAGQPLSLSLELALADPGALAVALDAVAAATAELSSLLRRGDEQALRAFLEEARVFRSRLEASSP
jgi:prephenate dehydrogenase